MNRQILWAILAPWLWLSVPCLAQAPADLIIVFDNSGSMRSNDPQVLAKDAVRRFIADLDGEYRLALMLFDQRVDLVVPLATPDATRGAALDAGIARINYRGQRTDIPAALERAVQELKDSSRADAAKMVLFLTDGIVDTGDPAADVEKARWVREDLARDAAGNGIRIFAIAFTEQADRVLGQTLARETGGAFYHAPAAADLQGVFASISTALNATVPSQSAPVAEVPAQRSVPATEVAPTQTPIPAPERVTAPAPDPQVAPVEPAPAIDTEPAAPEPVAATADDEFGVEDLTEEERAALREAGVAPEDLFSAEPGKAIIIPPQQQESRSGMVGLLALVAVAGVLLVGAALWLRSRRGRQDAVAGAAEARESPVRQARLDVRLRDVESITGRDSYVIADRPLMIGRSMGTDENLDYLVVDRPTVGRRHALLSRRGTQYLIADQGSVNGTYVNDQRISGERPLRHGDRLRFHKFVFEFDAPGLVPEHTTQASAQDATVVADAATLVGAAAIAVAHADRIGDTGIVAAGNKAAGEDWFGAGALATSAPARPAAPAPVVAPEPAKQPRGTTGDDVDASSFFDEGMITDFGRQQQTSSGRTAPVMPDVGAEEDDALLRDTVITPPGGSDPFADFGVQLADLRADAGPPTEENDLSATPFLATSAFDSSNSGATDRSFEDLDIAMGGFEDTVIHDQPEDNPGTVRLERFNPDLTTTDDDFDVFDVTGEDQGDSDGKDKRSDSGAGDRDHD